MLVLTTVGLKAMAEADKALKASASQVRRGVKVAFMKTLLLLKFRHWVRPFDRPHPQCASST
jgi:hypothetical protein